MTWQLAVLHGETLQRDGHGSNVETKPHSVLEAFDPDLAPCILPF